MSAAYRANKYRAYDVQAKSSWARKALLGAILKEMGVLPGKTVYELVDQACEQLALSGRPLIIDEMDFLVKRGMVELVRDLYEGSGAAMLLIGEEMLPDKLKPWERFHNRILQWAPAQPCELADTRALARLYCREVQTADDLLECLTETVHGNASRICVNIAEMRQVGMSEGREAIDRAFWGDRGFYTGQAPKRRF